ncbi:GIY-YIG nuclease family protein [uncultured Flavobacterium sp.]|uniref:GIY-YIG nuclease family protein n=1 Tax=uncultured Flavobacterium sp. TaxID=165435 RepID=UPI0027E023AA|nr:GIY-YIG nuclease family protein [uncultured Flavobacterium sp.]
MDNKKKTLQDIFDDDELGILNSAPKQSNVKTEDERLIESFEEINTFFEKNNREPQATNVTEFKLLSRLKTFRGDEKKKWLLKPYDRFNLLGVVKEEIKSVEDILQDDDLGILDTDETLSIFKLENVPDKTKEEAEYIGRRKALKEKDFAAYEEVFKIVHKELREGKRKILQYDTADLKEGAFYILDGILMYFEKADIELQKLSTNKAEIDGRTRCIFENGTYSDMKYRSLKRAMLLNGKTVTHSNDTDETVLFNNANMVNEEDLQTGWIYILKSKSTHSQIAPLQDLYKIGYSTIDVKERIKNAAKEPTYLMADVALVSSFKCYNINPQKFENLLHRFFGKVCLNVDLFDEKGRRYTPREWFVAPIEIIERVIHLILSGDILNYEYDEKIQNIYFK